MGTVPMSGEIPTPKAVPIMLARIAWLPALAVTSARLDFSARDWCNAALDAEAERYEMFFPTLAVEATRRKEPGTRGDMISRSVEASMASEDTMRHLLGSASKARESPRYDAKRTPPSWPSPSFITQFRAAAMGMEPAPSPTAYSRDCIERTPPAEPQIEAVNW